MIVKKAYPGDSWKTKVRKMSDSQVFAIYSNLTSNKIKKPKPTAKVEDEIERGVLFMQLTGEQLHLSGF